MNRGFYHAASAMLTIQKNMQSIANNVANSGTTGYKREQSIEGNFGKMMVFYKNENLGQIETKVGQRDNVTIHSQGNFQVSGRELDFALEGERYYFKTLDDQGNTKYTRNGIFFKDADGYIVDYNGYYMLDKDNNKIQVPSGTIAVKENGDLYVNNEFLTTISISNLNNPIKTGQGYYSGIPTENTEFRVFQGMIESSNVDMGKEISDMIVNQRSYQLNQRMVMTQDELNKKIISDILK